MVFLIILLTAAPRFMGRTWIGALGPHLLVEHEGFLVEWEWIDVLQTVLVAEGSEHWGERSRAHVGGPARLSQNGSRFLPGVLIALLLPWVGGIVLASNVWTLVCWVVSVFATAALCTSVLRHTTICTADRHRAGQVAGALAVVSPGFHHYAGQVDPHPFGYAAAPLAMLLLDRAVFPAVNHVKEHLGRPVANQESHRRSAIGSSTGASTALALAHTWSSAAVWYVALVFFVANATLEIGPPLLVLLVVVYAAYGWLLRDARWREAAVLAVGVPCAYLALQVLWWGLLGIVTEGRIATYNSWGLMVAQSLGLAEGRQDTLLDVVLRAVIQGVITPTPPVFLLGLVGLVVAPPRVRVWALVWILTVTGGAAVSRMFPRTLYLAYPAWYVLGAWAAVWCGQWLSRTFSSQGDGYAHRIDLTEEQPTRRDSTRVLVLRWLPAGGLVAAAAGLVLSDLAGHLAFATAWWRQ